jgi:antitoxin HicB
MYVVILTPDDNGTLLVTCPDLPEVTTFGEDVEDALRRAAAAIAEALATRIDRDEDIPTPLAGAERRTGVFGSRRKIRSSVVARLPRPNRRMVNLPPLTKAKVELYRAIRDCEVSRAELGRRLGWDGRQVDRLFKLSRRATTIQHIDQALRAIGKRLDVCVRNAA